MAQTSARNYASFANAFRAKLDAAATKAALLPEGEGGGSITPSQMQMHYAAGMAAAVQGDLDGAQQHLSWLAGCLRDLGVKFSKWSDTSLSMVTAWEADTFAGEAEVLYNTAKKAVRYIRRIAMKAGLHYWPGMLVQHQSLRAMLRAEQLRLRWLGCAPWNDKEKGGGWNAEGHYGWDAHRILSMFRRAGCKLGPRFDRLLRLHHEGLPTNCMKRSFSADKQLAVARGFKVVTDRHVRHSNQALAVLGRLDPRVAVVAVVGYKRRTALGLADNAIARARHIDMEAVARATELWRQIDAGEEYTAEEVTWYASHIDSPLERCKFVWRASPYMQTCIAIHNGNDVVVRRGSVQTGMVKLKADHFLAGHYVYPAAYEGKMYYTLWHMGGMRLIPIVHPDWGIELSPGLAVPQYLRKLG